MKIRRPPAIAAWLIARNSPLAGDLLEEFQRGRSRGWFWRQALMAIAVGWGRNIRVSQLYLKAFFIGFAAHAAVAFVLWRFHLVVFRFFAGLLLLLLRNAPFVVLKLKIAGSAGADLSRILAERGEMKSQKRTAISRLVAVDAFTQYLFNYCVFGYLSLTLVIVWDTGGFLFDVVRVVFCPGLRPASGKRP